MSWPSITMNDLGSLTSRPHFGVELDTVTWYKRNCMNSSLQDVERAIDALTPQQIEELSLRLDSRYPQPIDGQLEADLQSGRLDDRIGRALADHKAGRTRSL